MTERGQVCWVPRKVSLIRWVLQEGKYQHEVGVKIEPAKELLEILGQKIAVYTKLQICVVFRQELLKLWVHQSDVWKQASKDFQTLFSLDTTPAHTVPRRGRMFCEKKFEICQPKVQQLFVIVFLLSWMSTDYELHKAVVYAWTFAYLQVCPMVTFSSNDNILNESYSERLKLNILKYNSSV